MLLLCLDTASAAVSVALSDGATVLASDASTGAPKHAELLAPMIESVLREVGAAPRDLTAVVAGAGPGPYTGLRVGLATARTLALTLGIPAHGVCSLDAVAAAALDGAFADGGPPEFLVATDARRREVYWARYRREGGVHRRVSGPDVAKPADVGRLAEPVAGRGALLYPDALGDVHQPLDPPATGIARLAAALLGTSGPGRLDVPLLAPDPLYLRRPDAVPPGERKPVRP